MVDILAVVKEAEVAARSATNSFIKNVMNGEDCYPCGFAWVTIYEYEGKKIRKNSKIGKMLEFAGVKKK